MARTQFTFTFTNAQTIDGAASVAIATQWASKNFQSDGTNWLVI